MQNHAIIHQQLHPFYSPWWQWPLGWKPIAHYLEGTHQIWAIPNFLTFWLGLYALGKTLIDLFTRNEAKNQATQLILLSSGYFSFLVPWIVIFLLNPKSSASYLHYYLPSLPFLHLITANWLDKKLSLKGAPSQTFALSTLAIIPLLFFATYPQLVGI